MMSAERYRDADVRAKPSLMALAVNYAQAYRGDFDFMQAASAAANATGTLPVAVARGVLNCMRADPEIADQMPEAMAPDPLEWRDHFKDRREAIIKDIPPRRLKVVPPRRYIPVNVRLKFAYFWKPLYTEDVKNVFHIVSMVTRSHLENGVVHIYIAPICRATYANTAFIKVGNRTPLGYELCGSCKIQLDKGERDHWKVQERVNAK